MKKLLLLLFFIPLIGFAQFPCDIPTGLAVDDVTTSTADVTWEPAGDEEAWEIIYGLAGFDVENEGTIVEVDAPIYTIENLTPETDYEVYVRAVCDEEEKSDWSDAEAFSTEEEEEFDCDEFEVSISEESVICDGGSLFLIATFTDPSSSIVWSTGATSNEIEVFTAGEYIVYASNTEGCSASDTIEVTIGTSSSVTILADELEFCEGSSLTLEADYADENATLSWSTGGTGNTITVNASGTYTVTLTSESGCVSTDFVDVVAHPKPVIDMPNVVEICEGESAVLDCGNTDNDASVLWSTGATTNTITVSTGGVYDVTVTSLFGCSSTKSTKVNVKPLPVLDSINVTYNSDGSITFKPGIADNITGYTWSFGDGQTAVNDGAPTHFYSEYGQYTVTVTATNDCGSVTITITVNHSPAGLTTENINAIKLYPNPANNIITVDYEGTSVESVMIVSLLGKVVYNESLSESNYLIDVKNFQPGFYIANIILSDGNSVQRKFEVVK